MVSMDQEQYLGHKAFILILLKRSLAGVACVFIAAILFATHETILQTVISALGEIGSGPATGEQITNISTYLADIDTGFLALALIIFAFGLLVTVLIYKNYTFTFQEFGLRLRRGILTIEEVSIPYRAMQDINIHQSIFERIIGVSKVVIDSAGHEESDKMSETDIILEPLNREIAIEIRDLLQHKIGVQVVRAEDEAPIIRMKPNNG